MKIVFIGHVSIDINIIKSKTQIIPGGGVYYGAFVAKSFGWDTFIYTKGNPNDKELFKDLEEFGVVLKWIPSRNSTSINNILLTDNPDDRKSKIISRADPFTLEDIKDIESDIVHISPLWHGEFPEEFIEKLKIKTKVLGLDAQGFLRNLDGNGNMIYKDWEEKEKYLPLIDVFKVDLREAEILTGSQDIEKALLIISQWGPHEILLTYKDGVFLWVEGKIYEEKFGEWTLEGRTGRGDTCMSAYLVNRNLGYKNALKEAEKITTEKMKKPGPFKLS